MAYDDVGRKATNKYRAKFDMIQIRTEQGKREEILEHAKKKGESLNAFVRRAIDETIKRDNEKE